MPRLNPKFRLTLTRIFRNRNHLAATGASTFWTHFGSARWPSCNPVGGFCHRICVAGPRQRHGRDRTTSARAVQAPGSTIDPLRSSTWTRPPTSRIAELQAHQWPDARNEIKIDRNFGLICGLSVEYLGEVSASPLQPAVTHAVHAPRGKGWDCFNGSILAASDAPQQFRKHSMLEMSETEYDEAVLALKPTYCRLKLFISNATVVVNSKAPTPTISLSECFVTIATARGNSRLADATSTASPSLMTSMHS